MIGAARNSQVLTTMLTAGECLDRLRRISKRDDGQSCDPNESIFTPESLLLTKTSDGFMMRSRWRGSMPFRPVLQVKFEPGSASGERLKLIAEVGLHPGERTLLAIGLAVGVAVAGVVLHSVLRGAQGIVSAIPIAFPVLGWTLIPVLVRHATWGATCPDLLEVVRVAVDGDGWRTV
jgi:hypothetical protein